MPSSRNSAIGSVSEAPARRVQVERADTFIGRFRAMASPCEVLIDTRDASVARTVTEAVAQCAWRIEDKFSRYRSDNVVHAINTSNGAAVSVDEETAKLVDFAATLHELSGGKFDITSGVLRRAWTFDQGAHVPDEDEIAALLPLVGWNRVSWQRPALILQPGMQIDFGGIGKEYAVDQACEVARSLLEDSCLINFGGDLALSRPRKSGLPWRVGIEAAQAHGRPANLIALRYGALATSGDSYRFILRNGRRYTHILDPHTGWPIEDAPRSVTVAAGTCTHAGMLATLALLRGAHAENFLKQENAQYWIQWPMP